MFQKAFAAAAISVAQAPAPAAEPASWESASSGMAGQPNLDALLQQARQEAAQPNNQGSFKVPAFQAKFAETVQQSTASERITALLKTKPEQLTVIVEAVTQRDAAYGNWFKLMEQADKKFGDDEGKWPQDVRNVLKDLESTYYTQDKIAVAKIKELGVSIKTEVSAAGVLPKDGPHALVVQNVIIDVKPKSESTPATVNIGIRLLSENRLISRDDVLMDLKYSIAPNGTAEQSSERVKAIPLELYLKSDAFRESVNRHFADQPDWMREYALRKDVASALGLDVVTSLSVRKAEFKPAVGSYRACMYVEIGQGPGIYTNPSEALITVLVPLLPSAEKGGQLKAGSDITVREEYWR